MDTSHTWVAIVDDEAAIRRALLRLMRAAGVPARAFASGAELLAVLPASRPCCALLDLHMPAMSGLDLQARLAALAPATGVILMSGHPTPAQQAGASRRPPLACLLKPVDERALLDAIAAACPTLAP
ncbi:FixJ family two-component response regulator [Duganella sp. SG902]|uniref:response regulator transcription factor n=1 Tax=Duganella sp. SG902 TaxID=2587016 RepID=UPI00159D582D|nr:response regulator [Duganella sp. SG902]NVM80018.1 FixJ family two-component response regulator [Duganella sp. SG902]